MGEQPEGDERERRTMEPTAMSGEGHREAGTVETVPASIAVPMQRCPDYADFPTAWAIQTDRGTALPHHERCSSVPGWHVLSGPGLLCDCGAVSYEWQRLRALLFQPPTPPQPPDQETR